MGLTGIPRVLSPELLKVLCEMGHGDVIVLADTHFPSSSICQRNRLQLLRADGHDVSALLPAILKLFPLDEYVEAPVSLMAQVDKDKAAGGEPPVWQTYRSIVQQTQKQPVNIEYLARQDFYSRAAEAYAIVHTGETAKYGNIMLTKGLVDYAAQA